MTEIADRTAVLAVAPLLFENPKGYSNAGALCLLAQPNWLRWGMGQEDVKALHDVGKLLAFLKEPIRRKVP